MTRTITGLFDTRRGAETAVEHLAQEHGIDRARVRVLAAGAENTAGTVPSGADAAAAAEGEASGGALRGRVAVSLEADAAEEELVRNAFHECGATGIEPPDGA